VDSLAITLSAPASSSPLKELHSTDLLIFSNPGAFFSGTACVDANHG